MTELITTLPNHKMTRKLEVGKTYLRADGGLVSIVSDGGDGKRPFVAVRLCSDKDAGHYSAYGTKCRRSNGEDASPERGLNIVGEIVQ